MAKPARFSRTFGCVDRQSRITQTVRSSDPKVKSIPCLRTIPELEDRTMAHLPLGPLSPTDRREECFRRRVSAASQYRTAPIPENRNNGDEDRYPNKIGNFSKGLPHNNLGEVDLNAYQRLLDALQSGSPTTFENITLGCGAGSRKLVNPQAGLAFD